MWKNKINRYYKITALVIVILVQSVSAEEIYKYKDEHGNIKFADKKPKNVSVDTITSTNHTKEKVEPRIYIQKDKNKVHLIAENTLHSPIEIKIDSPQLNSRQKHFILAPQSMSDIFSTQGEILPYTYLWQMGDPSLMPQAQYYALPVEDLNCPSISQGFNGSFSHHDEYNQYAVDINLPVGTAIKAAKEGIVVAVKDDYHMGGTSDYFLDKANYVRVLHPDGTFALYLHILMGTAVVKPGDKIQTGTLLARSGSSGFSSGPHLHFVIEKNFGMHERSIAFQFIDHRGNTFTPTAGRTICN